MQPQSLIHTSFQESRGRLDAALASYGHLQYGSEMVTQLFFPSGNNLDGCTDFKLEDDFPSVASNSGLKEIFQERGSIMLRRGNCSFVKKSMVAQRIGARMTIIADNLDEDEDNIIMVDLHNQGD
jgi:hypothetical protein